MAQQRTSSYSGPRLPWWRVPMVWLVIGGPATVVVAAVITAVIAIRGADPVIGQQPEAKFADRPAVQGRNHAATPGTPR